MNTEIDELKEKVLYLEKRIEVLEKTERRRKAFKWISVTFKALFYIGIIVCLWLIYDYFATKINSIPNMIKQGIDNFDIGKFDFFGLFK